MTTLPPLRVAVVGFSGAGKTCLLERLVPELAAGGLTIGYLKADAHKIDLDEEGKDTFRLRQAGASACAICSHDSWVLMPAGSCVPQAFLSEGHLTGEAEWAGGETALSREALDHRLRCCLLNLQETFSGCDLLLIEGMKASPLPKILVNRADNRRGVIPPASLRNVPIHLDWPRLPNEWGGEISRAVAAIGGLLGKPQRDAARELVGALLAGGGSRRMGADEALLNLPGRHADPVLPRGTLLERAYACL